MQPVLVVIINNGADWGRVEHEGWYRIPCRSAPPALAADYLGFYFSSAFGDGACSVAAVAAVRGYRLVRRRDLLPDQAQHPRAGEWYYRVELGPVRRLARPVPSRRLRRIVFIPTTMEALLDAGDVAELWHLGEEATLSELLPGVLARAKGRPRLDPHQK